MEFVDCGQILWEADELRFLSSRELPEDALVRVDVEMKGNAGLCKWGSFGGSGGDSKYSSSEKQVFQSKAVEANREYVVGLSDICLKSTYIPLIPANMLKLGSVIISVQIVLCGTKGAKDEPLVDFAFSASEVFASKSFSKDSSEDSFPGMTNKAAFVIADQSSMSWKLSMDSDMAEYCVGSMIIRFPGPSTLSSPPIQFSLHYNDVLDPKAKVQPTPADLRTKYLDNINKLVEKQASICSYVININDSPVEGGISSFIPKGMMAPGSIVYDATSAAAVPIEEDIRQNNSLWSVCWESTPATFIHRSTKKQLAAAIAQNPMVSVTMTKTPSEEGKALEGEPTRIVGQIDLSALLEGSMECLLSVSIADSETSTLSLNISLSESIKTKGPSPNTTPLKSKSSTKGSTSQSKSNLSSTSSIERDIVGELNSEITSVLKKVACEFVSAYPLSDKEANEKPMDEKKAEFLHYLSTSTIYHELKERLKPRIQRVVELKFGQRMTQASEDIVLAELYVFLTKQCNLVINSLYSSETIEQDLDTINSEIKIDGLDSIKLKLKKLLSLSNDAEADTRFDYAEQVHLERIQIAQKTDAIWSDTAIVHGIYAEYAEFCLRQCSLLASHRKGRTDKDISIAKTFFDRAKESLSAAYSTSSDIANWKISLLYASMLIEYEQLDKAEIVLNSIIAGKNKLGSENIVSSLEGYDTDRLVLAEPLVYSVLAVLFQVSNKPLRLKKTLKLISKAYVACGCQPDAETHGAPKRTVVFCLASAAIHFAKYGMSRLASTCSSLAQQNEALISAKVIGIGRASSTVPFIRYFLKRSSALAQLSGDIISMSKNGLPSDDLAQGAALLASSEKLLRDSLLISTDREDLISSSLDLARVLTLNQATSTVIIDSLSNTLSIASASASSSDLTHRIPIQMYLQLSKLLFEVGRLGDASSVAITGAKAHSSRSSPSSSSLMLLIGICALRNSNWVDAEDALIEANTIDNRYAEVWAYICLNCILSSKHRLVEAERTLFQSIRLGLRNTALLREISFAFMNANKLEVAEDVIRRVVSMESLESDTGRASPLTRHLLGCILDLRNLATQAIEEYQAVVADSFADKSTRIDAAKRCTVLVETLGRTEDRNTLNKILIDLTSAEIV